MTDKKTEVEEEVVVIDGVEYVRKNPKKLIEEPVLNEDDDKTLLTE